MPPTMNILFKAFRVLLISLYIALFVVESVLNPNFSSTRILYLFKCSFFSSTFEGDIKIDMGL